MRKIVNCKVCGGEVAKNARMCPHCGTRNPGMTTQQTVGIIVAVIICSFIVCLPILTEGSKPNSAPESSNAGSTVSAPKQEEPKEEVIAIAATDLGDAYRANQVNADNLYKDKTLSITGTVTNIGKDALSDAPCVSLSSGSPYNLQPVQCFFPKSEENSAAIAALQNGQEITIVGKCQGISLVNLQISKCSLAG